MSIPSEAAGLLLDLAPLAPPIGVAELAPAGGVMVVVPHPDDETLGCGMALAEAADAARSIVLVMVTDGEGSHPTSPSVTPEQLCRIRQLELDEALRSLLGGRDVHVEWLSLPDGRSEADQVSAAQHGKLKALANLHDIKSVWTTWQHDPHCDHKTAAILGSKLALDLSARLWEFAVWGRFSQAVPAPLNLRRFEAGSSLIKDRKRMAMAAYRSQFTAMIDDDPTAFRMPAALVEHFDTHAELFIGG